MSKAEIATTYVDDAAAALLRVSDDGEYTSADECRLLDLYTLLVLVKGEDVTLEDVHDAWAIYRSRTRPDHSNIVPFDELEEHIKVLDQPYAEAIRTAAQKLR